MIQRWHSDVPWGTPIWKATQLLSLYQVMDRPGPITKDRQPLGATNPWGVDEPLRPAELRTALARLAELRGIAAPSPSIPAGDHVSLSTVQNLLKACDPSWADASSADKPANPEQITAGEFALIAARVLAK